jgi:hypothetical protein
MWPYRRGPSVTERVATLEADVDALLRRSGVEPPYRGYIDTSDRVAVLEREVAHLKAALGTGAPPGHHGPHGGDGGGWPGPGRGLGPYQGASHGPSMRPAPPPLRVVVLDVFHGDKATNKDAPRALAERLRTQLAGAAHNGAAGSSPGAVEVALVAWPQDAPHDAIPDAVCTREVDAVVAAFGLGGRVSEAVAKRLRALAAAGRVDVVVPVTGGETAPDPAHRRGNVARELGAEGGAQIMAAAYSRQAGVLVDTVVADAIILVAREKSMSRKS